MAPSPNDHAGDSAEIEVASAAIDPQEKINNSLLQNPYLLGVALVCISLRLSVSPH